jgi:hypothetical protein
VQNDRSQVRVQQTASNGASIADSPINTDDSHLHQLHLPMSPFHGPPSAEDRPSTTQRRRSYHIRVQILGMRLRRLQEAWGPQRTKARRQTGKGSRQDGNVQPTPPGWAHKTTARPPAPYTLTRDYSAGSSPGGKTGAVTWGTHNEGKWDNIMKVPSKRCRQHTSTPSHDPTRAKPSKPPSPSAWEEGLPSTGNTHRDTVAMSPPPWERGVEAGVGD